MKSKIYNIYILRCGDGSLYTGIALDIKKRLKEHRIGQGAKYTRIPSRQPLILVALFSGGNRSEASKVEYYIKKLNKEKKEYYLKHQNQLANEINEKLNIKIEKIDFETQTGGIL
jgi:putative endonuclease